MRSLRENFHRRDFLEVETPMLQTVHGGAAARPFGTHMNAFDLDLYLRIAPELFLKRAVVGGVERVFEINRNFRNEGADSTHSPEFAMLEAYEAYGDYDTMAELTQDLVQRAALDVLGTTEVTLPDGEDVRARRRVGDPAPVRLAVRRAGRGGHPRDAARRPAACTRSGSGSQVDPKRAATHGKLVEELWEHLVGDHLYAPDLRARLPGGDVAR